MQLKHNWIEDSDKYFSFTKCTNCNLRAISTSIFTIFYIDKKALPEKFSN